MKFKVGDRVRAINIVDGICLKGKRGTVVDVVDLRDASYDLCVEFDEAFPQGHTGPDGKYNRNCCRWGHNNEFEHVVAKKKRSVKYPKIVITTDGKETLARLYDESGKVTKSATASCHPDDPFDFELGARTAFERLMEDDKTPEIKARKPFTGKAVCIANEVGYSLNGDITVGKIYDFSENGGCGKNDGDGKILCYPRYTIDEINNAMDGYIVFLEIKE